MYINAHYEYDITLAFCFFIIFVRCEFKEFYMFCRKYLVKNGKSYQLYMLLIIICVLFFYSCTTENRQSKKVIIRYNESKGIASLDPAFARNQSVIWAVTQLYNGLLQIDDSLNIKPCIAKNYFISNDGKVYTFHLRTDVYFHSSEVFPEGKGRKVNAHDVVFSFNRIIDPKVASPGSWIFEKIDRSKGTNGFEAVNDSTVRIYLSSPFSSFPGVLTMPYCYIVAREAVEFYGKDFRKHPVGTGPFVFKRWVEGEKLILAKNPDYFEFDPAGNRLPYVDGVSISFIVDKQSEFLEFMTRKLDFISGVNASFKDELLTHNGELKPLYQHRICMLKSAYLNIEYIGILVRPDLCKNHALLDVRVRRAINLAINRKKMITFLRNNIGFPAYAGFVPKGVPSFCDTFPTGYSYNPDSAKKLLCMAGYCNGKGIETIKLTTTADYADICEFIQHELSKIGLIIDVEVVNGLAYREMLANGRMQMFRASWIADYPDAESFLSLFYSKNIFPNGPNYTGFVSSEYDKWYQLALNESNAEKRRYYYLKMDSIIIEQAPVVPLFYDQAVRFTQPYIKNLGINPFNLLVLKHVKKLN